MLGTEAMMLTEMMIPTARSCLQIPESNNQDHADDLEVLYELRDSGRIRMATYQLWITKSYNKNIRVRSFQMGDLVHFKIQRIISMET